MDFSKLKVAELREECEKRGLDSSGKKAELVSRLEGSSSTCASTGMLTWCLAGHTFHGKRRKGLVSYIYTTCSSGYVIVAKHYVTCHEKAHQTSKCYSCMHIYSQNVLN